MVGSFCVDLKARQIQAIIMGLNGEFAENIISVPFSYEETSTPLLLFRRDSIDSFFQRYFHESGFNSHAQTHPISQYRSSSLPALSTASMAPDNESPGTKLSDGVWNLHRGDQSRQIVQDDNGDITIVEVATLGRFAPVDFTVTPLLNRYLRCESVSRECLSNGHRAMILLLPLKERVV